MYYLISVTTPFNKSMVSFGKDKDSSQVGVTLPVNIFRGTKATRFVQCFTSHPSEMKLTPGDSFLLAANAVHELSVRIKSTEVGRRYMYVNVVDVDYHQLVRTWMISYDCQRADVRKTIKVKVPIGEYTGSRLVCP